MSLSGLQGSNIPARYTLHESVAVGARDLELPHVGDIEPPHVVAHRPMLGGDPGRVAHGHFVSTERHHLGAQRDVDLVERGALRTFHVRASPHEPRGMAPGLAYP